MSGPRLPGCQNTDDARAKSLSEPLVVHAHRGNPAKTGQLEDNCNSCKISTLQLNLRSGTLFHDDDGPWFTLGAEVRNESVNDKQETEFRNTSETQEAKVEHGARMAC